jgi:hypothetical protein
MSANTLSNISPNSSEVITFFVEPLDNFGKYPLCPAIYSKLRAEAGPNFIYFFRRILIFLCFRRPFKVKYPSTTTSGQKVMQEEERL